MTFVRRAGTVLATVLLTVGLIGSGPADAKRDTSWGGARDTSWGGARTDTSWGGARVDTSRGGARIDTSRGGAG